MTRTFVTKPEDDSIGFISTEANFWSTSYGFLQAYVYRFTFPFYVLINLPVTVASTHQQMTS